MLEHNTQQTSIEHLEEAVARLTQSHPFLSQNQTSLVQAQIDMNLKMDSLLERLANLTPIPTSPKFTPTPTPASCSRSHMKLEIPRFDGSNPIGWIFKATQFFEYQNLPDQEKITIARFYMEGPALSWFQWMHRNGFLTTWPSMHTDVHRFISHCLTCQQVKPKIKRRVGLLQPLPIPYAIWEYLSLDFITGLPSSHNYTTILVVVDRFTKGVHFGALPSQYPAFKAATLFIDTFCKLHGFPRSIVSDRDPLFISALWRELFRLSGTKLRMSTTYHPQTDGQMEVLNRVLKQYLRSFVHDRPSQWFKYLALAEWSYNTSVHSGTGILPFKATYGKSLPSIPHYIHGTSHLEPVDDLLATRFAIHDTLRRHLQKAQASMKAVADAH